MTATMTQAPECPKCGGAMFDETKSKFWDPAKNRPTFKCKRKGECDGAIWIKDTPAKAAPVTQRQPVSIGAPIAGLDEPYNQTLPHHAPVTTTTVVGTPDKIAAQFAVYDRCLAKAIIACQTINAAQFPVQASDIVAMAATLFIQASKP